MVVDCALADAEINGDVLAGVARLATRTVAVSRDADTVVASCI